MSVSPYLREQKNFSKNPQIGLDSFCYRCNISMCYRCNTESQ